MARARRERARAERLLRACVCCWPRRRSSDVMPARCWCGRDADPRRLLGLFPGADRKAALWSQSAGPRRLDPSLWPAWACRWSNAKRPKPVIAAFLLISLATRHCRVWCCCRLCRKMVPSPRRSLRCCAVRELPAADFNRHQRALLSPTDERSHYLERAMGRHQQKELRRRWRRLAETGAMLITAATEPAAVGRALDDFLALEAGGWKGRAGTATADHEPLRHSSQTQSAGWPRKERWRSTAS